MRPAERGLLLLCCRLGQEIQPLTAREYRQLAQRVQAAPPAQGTLTARHLWALGYDEQTAARIVALLDREPALERYLGAQEEITPLARNCEAFPHRLRRLQECPPALFCRGELSLLSTRAVALVGSRKLRGDNRRFAQEIGRRCAQEGFTLVSGGAMGADAAAQEACLLAGGSVICFVADELYRHPRRERVLYCSDEGYELPFTAARALRRNHYIHALGEKTFIAQCELGRGGTWAGAADNLRRGLSQVYAYFDGTEGPVGLCELGAGMLTRVPPSISALQPDQTTLF